MSFSCRFEAAVSFVTQNLGMSLSWYIVPSTAGAGSIHLLATIHFFTVHKEEREIQ